VQFSNEDNASGTSNISNITDSNSTKKDKAAAVVEAQGGNQT
jgi:hypothetical protein